MRISDTTGAGAPGRTPTGEADQEASFQETYRSADTSSARLSRVGAEGTEVASGAAATGQATGANAFSQNAGIVLTGAALDTARAAGAAYFNTRLDSINSEGVQTPTAPVETRDTPAKAATTGDTGIADKTAGAGGPATSETAAVLAADLEDSAVDESDDTDTDAVATATQVATPRGGGDAADRSTPTADTTTATGVAKTAAVETGDETSNSAAAETAGAAATPATGTSFGNGVGIDGKTITLSGEPFVMKSVGYSAENQGYHLASGGYADPSTSFAALDQDFKNIASTGANMVRIYDPFMQTPGAFEQMEKAAEKNGLKLLVTFPKNEPDQIASFAAANKDSDTILGYTAGNEVNYNAFYGTSSDPMQTAIDLSNVISAADGGNHPVFSSWADLPDQATVERLDAEGSFDGHTLNYYRDPTTADSYVAPLEDFAGSTDKPVLLGEYGTDSYDKVSGRENKASQKTALKMTNDHLANMVGEGTIQGMSVFGYKDQIYRGDGAYGLNAYQTGTGSYSAHPAANLGFQPNPNVPAIDGVQNDEYLGLTDAVGRPKPAFSEQSRFYSSI